MNIRMIRIDFQSAHYVPEYYEIRSYKRLKEIFKTLIYGCPTKIWYDQEKDIFVLKVDDIYKNID